MSRPLSFLFFFLTVYLTQANAQLTVNCVLPTAQAGVVYNGASCSATGGLPPYSYASSNLPQGLSINSTSGAITGTPQVQGINISFTVTATDSTLPTSLTGSFTTNTFVIQPPVLAINCTVPLNAQVNVAYSGSCSAFGGTPSYTFSATGAPSWLSINATTGAITGTPSTVGSYSFTLTVTDKTPQSVSQSVTNLVVSAPPLTLNCNAPLTAMVGVAYSGSCGASGGTPPYSFSATGTVPSWLTVNSSSGAISGTPTTSGAYSFTLQVKDAAGVVMTQAVSNLVVSGTPLSIGCQAPLTAQVGVAYTGSCTAQGGTPPYTYVVTGSSPPWLTLNSTTGAITGTPTTIGTYTFGLKVTDNNAQTATQAVTNLVVSPASVSISCTAPLTAQVGVAYAGSCTAQGGTPPYTFSAAGNVPPWLGINSATGAITGTPTTSGTYSFTLQVKDSSSQTASQAVNNLVVSGTPLSIGCQAPLTAQVNVAYTGSCTASGGAKPYTFSASGNVPPWLSINSTTGAITGTPTTTGTYTFGLNVTDSNAQSATQAVTNLVVSPTSVSINCTVPLTAQVGVGYSGSCTASGGTKPYTFSATGSFPSWLSVNSATGAITGTPTSTGTFTFGLKVTDNNAQSATQAVTNLVVSPTSVSINCTVPLTAQVGVGYSGSCTASGGTKPYTFSATGSFPPWLSVNSATGAITGTPGTPGTYTFGLKVTDNNAQSVSQMVTNLVVSPVGLSLSCQLNGNAQVGVVYSASCTAAGGTPPYAYSASGAPNWLVINASTGAISGTPTTAGTFPFTLKVTDNASQTATQTVANFVVAPSSVVLSCTLPANAQVGVPYTGAGCTANGGTPSYAYSIGASAPGGLTINPSSGAISGIPTTPGSFSFTISVVDNGSPKQTATQTITGFAVAPASSPVVPTFSFVGLPTSQTPGVSITGAKIGLSTSSAAWPITLSLSFKPNATGVPANYIDPALQFVDNSGNTLGTTYSVTVPALTNSITLPQIAPGTVAGQISLNLTVTGQTGASSVVTVPSSVPIITPGSVQILNVTSSGFDVEVVGNSSTRDLKTATFSFTAGSGATINGTTTFSVDVSSLMTTWYAGSASQAFGSRFLLTVPFTFSGSSSAIGSVTVTLTNSLGASSPVSGTN